MFGMDICLLFDTVFLPLMSFLFLLNFDFIVAFTIILHYSLYSLVYIPQIYNVYLYLLWMKVAVKRMHFMLLILKK